MELGQALAREVWYGFAEIDIHEKYMADSGVDITKLDESLMKLNSKLIDLLFGVEGFSEELGRLSDADDRAAGY